MNAALTLETILSDEAAQAAWHRVKSKRGAPGADDLKLDELDPIFLAQWAATRAAILAGSYQPQPVRRVRVPKPSGGHRTLGIPSVLDRVILQAINQALGPHFEPFFSSRSFAYRPGRGAHDALLAVQRQAHPHAHALHLDIAEFFDSVPHAVVEQSLLPHLSDPRLLPLIMRFLSMGVFENGLVRSFPRGLHQGSPLSPLLANLVLHSLDAWLETQRIPFVRYADDCLLLSPSASDAQRILPLVESRLQALGLSLNPAKTQLAPLAEVHFLGFAFAHGPSGLERRISRESLETFRLACERVVDVPGPWEEARLALASFFQAWQVYFGFTQDPSQLQAAATHAGDALRARLWREHSFAQRRAILGSIGLPATLASVSVPSEHPLLLHALRQRFPDHALGLLPKLIGQPSAKRSSAVDYAGHVLAADSSALHALWRPTALLWLRKLTRGRLLRVGVDFSPRRRSLLPRPSALRLTLGFLNLRFRLRP